MWKSWAMKDISRDPVTRMPQHRTQVAETEMTKEQKFTDWKEDIIDGA